MTGADLMGGRPVFLEHAGNPRSAGRTWRGVLLAATAGLVVAWLGMVARLAVVVRLAMVAPLAGGALLCGWWPDWRWWLAWRGGGLFGGGGPAGHGGRRLAWRRWPDGRWCPLGGGNRSGDSGLPCRPRSRSRPGPGTPLRRCPPGDGGPTGGGDRLGDCGPLGGGPGGRPRLPQMRRQVTGLAAVACLGWWPAWQRWLALRRRPVRRRWPAW
jgi:hypothetical protein